jgi:hypothetical protein
VVDASGVKKRGSTLDPVDFVAFGKEELREIGTVLTGNTRNEGFLQKKTLLLIHRAKLR